MRLRPVKHEKEARIGRNSNVFRIEGAQSAEQSVGIIVRKSKRPGSKGHVVHAGMKPHEVEARKT